MDGFPNGKTCKCQNIQSWIWSRPGIKGRILQVHNDEKRCLRESETTKLKRNLKRHIIQTFEWWLQRMRYFWNNHLKSLRSSALHTVTAWLMHSHSMTKFGSIPGACKLFTTKLTPSKFALTTVSNILWQCVRYIIINVSTWKQNDIIICHKEWSYLMLNSNCHSRSFGLSRNGKRWVNTKKVRWLRRRLV